VVEERQRLARLQRLQPERYLAQLNRHRVHVHTVHAAADHVAQGVARRLGRRLVVAGARRRRRFARRCAAAIRKWPLPQAGSQTLRRRDRLGRIGLAAASASTGSSAESSRHWDQARRV